MESKVIVEISYSGRNFGAHVPLLPGCVATGNTPEAVMKNITDAIEFHLEGMKDDGDPIPKQFRKNFKLIYKFDAKTLLQYYKGIFTNAALERITGINQRQLQHYSSGLKKPRPTQAKKIESALHRLGEELLAVEL